MRMLLMTAWTVFALAVLAGSVPAQLPKAGYGRYSRPAFGPGYRGNISPYLNLARTNNNLNPANPAIDYYLGTRSEQARRSNAQQFSQDIRMLEIDQESLTTGTVPQRGTIQRYFNNTGGYFPGPGGR